MNRIPSSADVMAVVTAARGIGDPTTFHAPYGYPDSLALCILDSIWSIGVHYSSVENVVSRYREWLAARGADADSRSAFELGGDIAGAGGTQGFADSVVCNQQLTSTRGGVSKAEAVLQAANALVGVGVNTASELRERAADETVKSAWLSVHGQGSGVSWYYATMLALVEDVKPDRMVLRFISRAIERDVVDPAEARAILAAAHAVLVKEFPSLGLRALDYVVWAQEARPPRSGAAPAC